MQNKVQLLDQIIKERRSIYPTCFSDKPIDKATILHLLENANYAPNHKKTEPWRFKVFMGAGLKQLSDYMANYYENNTPESTYSETKHKKIRQKALKSGAAIAICMKRHEEGILPEIEEIEAVACAVQNLWLSASVRNIGGYWASPKMAYEAAHFLKLKEGERCLGFFFLGYHTLEELPPAKRKDVKEKTEWID